MRMMFFPTAAFPDLHVQLPRLLLVDRYIDVDLHPLSNKRADRAYRFKSAASDGVHAAVIERDAQIFDVR